MTDPLAPDRAAPDNLALFEAATRLERLEEAWRRTQLNAGAAGGDGVTVAAFAQQAPSRLLALHRALREGRYRPGPLRRVPIPKPDGGSRPLDIPCVVDRIAQGAVALTLGPWLEPEMEEASFAYRPGRSVQQAVARIDRYRREGFDWVVDGDIERYFESVPHEPLLARLHRSIGAGPLGELIALWLEDAMPEGRGLPQGSPLSPLLSNLYLDEVDEALAGRGLRLVRFADDFVVLCRSRGAAEATLDRTAKLLAERGLELNREKTRIVSFDQGFRFLGHLFVRSLVLKAARRDEGAVADSAAALLRQIAEQDERALSAAEARAAEERAGFDRVLRVLYLGEPGRRLALRNTAFSVEEAVDVAERRGARDPAGWREILALPHQQVDRIEIGPAAGASLDALRHAIATETPVAFVNGNGLTLGQLVRTADEHAGLQLAQARHCLDPALRCDLARRLVDGRIRNQRALLRRLNRRRKDKPVVDALLGLNRALRKLPLAEDVAALMGHEGAAAALFWPALGRLLEGDWGFAQRRRRPPPDPVNATVSFLSSLLTRDVEALVRRHGLHPGFGALHVAQDGHAACVYDLVEEFRAPLAEGLAAYLINARILRPELFGRLPDGTCRIGREAARAMIRHYERWLDRPVRSPRGGRRILWRRLIEEQVVAYAAHSRGGEPYRPYVMDY